jgi:hypothetical protein
MDERADELLAKRLRILQIIALAMIQGVVIFLGIVLYLVHGRGQGPPPERTPIVSIVAVVFLIVNGGLALVVPKLLVRVSLRRIAAGSWAQPGNAEDYATDASKLIAVHQQARILGLAFMEGTAFIGIVAYLLEQRAWVLNVPGVALGLMLALFPTYSKLRLWQQDHEDRLQSMRQEGA